MISPVSSRWRGLAFQLAPLAMAVVILARLLPPAMAQSSEISGGASGRHYLHMDCDCPGCRAYLDACDSPCPPAGPGVEGFGPEPMPPMEPDADRDRAGAEAIDPGAPDDAAAQPLGPMPSLSAGLGAVAAAASGTPNMIGDLFGATSGQSFIALDRLFVIGSDIDALVPSPNDDVPFTASESPSAVAVAEGFTTGMANEIVPIGVIRIEPATAEFTTAASTGEVRQALQADPQANTPIVNNPAYQGLANDDLVTRNGAGGQTQFNPDPANSFAHLQDGSLPSGGPGAGEDYDAVYAYDYLVVLPFDSLGGAPGANVGRQKATENGSPIPRDRIISNFSYFHNTPLLNTGQEVVRNVSGFEKTFFDSMTSIELRVPYASTLDSTVALDPNGLVGGTNGELGNMTLYAKLLLLENRRFALGAGLGVAIPTANDFVINDAAGTEVLRVQNESPHLLPYLGFVWTPNPNWFYQGFVQVDVDTQGNAVSVSPFQDGAYTGELAFAGRLHDKDLIYVDLAVGYWLYQSRQTRGLTGLAPIVEIHYNGSVDAGDPLTTDTFRSVGDSSFDVVNAVAGAVIQVGGDKSIMLGYATPLGGDEQYDGEFRMNLNWFFGPSSQRNARRPY